MQCRKDILLFARVLSNLLNPNIKNNNKHETSATHESPIWTYSNPAFVWGKEALLQLFAVQRADQKLRENLEQHFLRPWRDR